QDDADEQLQGVVEVQGALGVRVQARQLAHDAAGAAAQRGEVVHGGMVAKRDARQQIIRHGVPRSLLVVPECLAVSVPPDRRRGGGAPLPANSLSAMVPLTPTPGGA